MGPIRNSLVFVAVVVVLGCASRGGPRHIAAVSVLTVHSTLAAIQDTEALMVCGTATAPPVCLTPEQHRAFAGKLVTAFDLDARILREVRAWPVGAPLPPTVTNLLAEVRGLITELMALIPAGLQRDRLVTSLTGGA